MTQEGADFWRSPTKGTPPSAGGSIKIKKDVDTESGFKKGAATAQKDV